MDHQAPPERLGDVDALDRGTVDAADAAMREFCSGTMTLGLDFDAFAHAPAELCGVVLGMFCRLGIATRAPQLERLLGFVAEVAAGYRPNPYHSWFHAVDVTYMVYYSLTEGHILPFLSRAETCALLLSAVAHDVLHPGKNNLFQINSNAEVAKKYNGVSVLENQSADHCFALMRKWDLLNTLNLDETDDSLPPSLHEGSDSRSEVEASDCESEGGLWIGGPSPVVAGRSTPSGAAPALKRSTDSPRPAESPRPTGSRRASIASLGSGSLRGGRKGSGRSARDRQAELAQMVEDLMLSAILYTDMKSHFQLQDRLEKIIEQAEQDDPAEDEEEDRSPFVAAAIRRRASVPPPMPSAPSQNSQTSFGSSGGAVRDEDADEDDDEDEDEDSEALDAVETTASEEPFSISNAADDILSQHSSQSWIRRKSVMVVHADDPNPSLDGNPEDRNSGMSYGHRRRSILVQHADDSDPHGDDEEESVGTPLETVASVPSIAPSDRRKSISAVSEHSTSSSGPQGTTNWEDTPNANITHEPLDVPPQPQGGPRRPSVQFSDVDEIVRLRAAVPQPTSAGRRRKSMEFEQRRLLLTAILHAADISNPARPWPLCKKWSDFVVQEFFEQGDAERALNLTISPNMDRTSSDQYAISLGFIDFLCKPFLEVLTDLLPALAPLLDNLNANREKWAELQREEKERAEREAVEREVEAAEAAARAGRISVSRTTTQGTEEVPIGAREEGGEGHEQLPAQFGRLSLSARSSVDASSLSTEPASPISSKRSLPDESASGGGRRFSAAAGTIELPDANWFATHRRPSRPAKGLSALHSFSAFLNWKRLHSGASTPNLVGLLQQQQGGEQPGAVERTASSPNSTRRLTADAAAVDYFSSGGGVGAETGPSEDVLQAIGWDDFVATEEQKEAIKESATVPGRRRSGPNLSGLGMTMTVLNERERLKKRVGGTGALRSASVDVYRPSAGVDEEGKGQ